MIRFGYKASAEQFAPRELLGYGVQAERLGFDSVFVSDHLQPWRHDGGHAPAALPWLGALAAGTERVLLGTSVLTPTFRYHPAVVAQAFATLGCLAPGRVILGVGSGESLNEVPLGLAWPDGKERFARLKEAVTLIRRLWTEDRVTFEGAFYRTEVATIYDKPEQPVPIYIGASGPAATRLAGRIADGFITTSGKGRELYTETLLPAVREGAEKADRPLDDLDLMIEVKVSFDPDLEKARNDTHYWGALALSPEEKTGVEDPIEMQRRADALSVDRTVTRWIVSSDPDEHAAKVAEYLEMGFKHLVFHAPGPDQDRFLHVYGEEILPRLRDRAKNL
ncbi:glucose-6-phosphate dehydrogenase (coenzyme-F420) [Amorphoplanes digitatis]|uniref:Coenzyme F420-dependent glucose-6-phosphate dehydrogenase n=1 Tax=Actinoplanes digitatis TaxID=1868 RepID=A0A7W7HUQ7_9ACTN|nr:glucose-6-phosphate dehydrogenase (coenzyme-F420) [Actinoplanes digitatis]MBB4761080.1 coenzyme F420-dependent glucose-6-phosphate dehydrogenase [Actinoplanes digitatis]BFE69423.1 glucose-6-phosphate dehydrogenase (coenzyme-F420) [Actinoplanes digitatis]GID92696.1 F420-dependent glucose-6-phosphate dehydrogenase [Actinoplanes digitatis]